MSEDICDDECGVVSVTGGMWLAWISISGISGVLNIIIGGLHSLSLSTTISSIILFNRDDSRHTTPVQEN